MMVLLEKSMKEPTEPPSTTSVLDTNEPTPESKSEDSSGNSAEVSCSLVSSQTSSEAPASLPSEETTGDEFRKLDVNYIFFERCTWWILTGIVCLVSLVGWFFLGLLLRGTFDVVQFLWLLLIILLGGMGFLASLYFPGKTYASVSWRATAKGIEIHHGIWWRHRVFVPRDRIQHTDVQQGPLMRAFGLAQLVINTGGTHEPSIPLGGLSLQVAESVRDQLSNRPDQHRLIATSASSSVGVATDGK
jgi:uncharacterized protein